MKNLFPILCLILLAVAVAAQTPTVAVVSAATYSKDTSRGAVVAIFAPAGGIFTDAEALADAVPLPTTLAGVTVEVDGKLCGIAAALPVQINAVLPDALPLGPVDLTVTVRMTRGNQPGITGTAHILPSAPGIFTAGANGTGRAAYVWFEIFSDGRQQYYAAGNLPFLQSKDQLFLLLYGTGMHEARADLFVGSQSAPLGVVIPSVHSVPTVFPGLWQIGFRLPVPSDGSIPNILTGLVRFYGQDGQSWDSQPGLLVLRM